MDNDSQLDKLLNAFLSKARQIVTENIVGNPVSFALSTTEVHFIEGSRSQIFRKPDYGKLVYSLKKRLLRLNEYRKLLSFVKKEVKYFNDDTGKLGEDLIMQLLIRFLDLIGHGLTNYESFP